MKISNSAAVVPGLGAAAPENRMASRSSTVAPKLGTAVPKNKKLMCNSIMRCNGHSHLLVVASDLQFKT